MRLFVQKTLPLLLAILSTAQATVAQDSTIAETMKSVIFVPFRGGHANRNKPNYYINGLPASMDKVKAACMTSVGVLINLYPGATPGIRIYLELLYLY
jgi:hypothetical protein